MPHAVIDGLVDLDFVDAEDGYLFVMDRCPAGCVLATRDGGRSWQSTRAPSTVQLVNGTNDVYALTEATEHRSAELLRTVSGDVRWTHLLLPAHASAAYNGTTLVLAADHDMLALLQAGAGFPTSPGRRGSLWISVDHGAHWSARVNPCTFTDSGAALVTVALNHPNALLVDCYDGKQSSDELETQHHLYGSTDNGTGWIRLTDPADTGGAAMLADNGAGHAFLVTGGGLGYQLRVSLDGASHWHTVLSGGDGGYGMGDLRFVNAEVGFVLGPRHYSTERLYRTDDAGRTWKQINTPSP